MHTNEKSCDQPTVSTRILTGIVITLTTILSVGIILASLIQPAHANDVERVTYCETNRVAGYQMTFIETSFDREFTVLNQTVRRGVIQGQRHLVESPVLSGHPLVSGCMIRIVNGQRAAVLTTVGGAEWLVINPRVDR